MQLNKQRPTIRTHEGAPAKHINSVLQLRRSVMACMLWEKQFYESGKEISERIAEGVKLVPPSEAFSIAFEARTQMKLRHVPLLIARELARHPDKAARAEVAELLEGIVQRPDELTEFLAIYWKDGRKPLSAQAKKGLARAFAKFDEYQLAKYNRTDKAIQLRDVLFLCHPKPRGKDQGETWKKLADRILGSADTWEASLSSGESKKETFTRLLSEKKLGSMALLRNLRNMRQAGVDDDLIKAGIEEMNVSRVLPFRFITAARFAPNLEPCLEKAMFKATEGRPKLPGRTIILVDVSGSMDWGRISSKSEVTRLDAACGLAMVAREVGEDVRVFTFSNDTVEVPPRRGFALRDAIYNAQLHSGTMLGAAVGTVNREKADRLIVISDEQSHQRVPDSTAGRSYMINVASYTNGVGYGKWTHLDGFSEAVLDYIYAYETAFER